MGAFGLTAFICLSRDQRDWRVPGYVFCLCSAEVAIGARHMAHNLASGWLGSAYTERKPWQAALILVLLACFGLVFARILFQNRPWTIRLAYLMSLLAVALFLVETVSVHAIDAILYKPAGPVLSIAWLWAAVSLSTVFAAMADTTRRPRKS